MARDKATRGDRPTLERRSDQGGVAPSEQNSLIQRGTLGRLLIAACVGQFLTILNISVVYVALPKIQHDLQMPRGDVQWIVNSYALMFAGLLLLGGRLADAVGPRTVFVTGMGLFVAASGTAAITTSSGMLFVARGIQGVAGAALSPASMALVTTEFPEGEQRRRALGVWSAWAGAGGAAGPLVGGLLVTLGGWRTVLAFSCPLGAAALVLALASFKAVQVHDPRVVMRDASRGLLETGSILLLVFGLSQVGAYSADSVHRVRSFRTRHRRARSGRRSGRSIPLKSPPR